MPVLLTPTTKPPFTPVHGRLFVCACVCTPVGHPARPHHAQHGPGPRAGLQRQPGADVAAGRGGGAGVPARLQPHRDPPGRQGRERAAAVRGGGRACWGSRSSSRRRRRRRRGRAAGGQAGRPGAARGGCACARSWLAVGSGVGVLLPRRRLYATVVQTCQPAYLFLALSLPRHSPYAYHMYCLRSPSHDPRSACRRPGR